MADIADIGIKVDSSDVKSANSQMDAFAAKGRKAQSASDEFGKRSNKAFSAVSAGAKRAQSAIDQLAKRMAQLGGLAVVGGIALSIKRFSDFEKQLVAVGKTADLEGAQLQKLGERIQDIGERVALPTSRLLSLAAAAGQIGVKGVDDISKFADTMGKLELATDVAGEQGARSLGRLLNITGRSASEIDRLGSAITALGNNMAVTEQEIVRTSTFMAASTSQFDLTTQEVVGLSAALKALGQRAETSGSAVGRAFNGIQKAIIEGGEGMQMLQNLLGKTGEEIQRAFGRDSVSVLLDFTQALGGIRDEGGRYNAVLEEFELSGQEARRVIGALASDTESARKAVAMANDEWERNQALSEEAAKQAETFSGQMQIVGNSLNRAAVIAGRELAPVLLDLATDFRDFLENARDTGQLESFFSQAAGWARDFVEELETVARLMLAISGGSTGARIGASVGGPVGGLVGGAAGSATGFFLFDAINMGAEETQQTLEAVNNRIVELQDKLNNISSAASTSQIREARQELEKLQEIQDSILKKRVERQQEDVTQAALAAMPNRGGGGPDGGPDGGPSGGGEQEISDLEREYRKLNQQLEKQIILFDDSSHEAEILYETMFGSLKDLKPLEKEQLQRKARRKDQLEEERELQEQLIDQQRDVTEAALEAQRELNEEGERIMEKREREMERQMERQAEILRRPFENAIDGIQDSFADFFNDVFQGGVDSFSKLATSIKNIFFNMISQLASQRIMSAILGGGATVAAGGAQAATGGLGGIFGGGGGGFGLDTLLSGGKALMSGLSFPGLASAGYSLTGSSIGANALGFGPAGGIGILGAKLLGLGQGIGGTIGGIGGSLAGGAAGGALASSLGIAALGPVGAIAGGFLGSAVGGLFGNNEPSSGAAEGFLSRTGRVTARGDLGGKTSQGTIQAREKILDQVGQFIQTINRDLGISLSSGLFVGLNAQRDPSRVRIGGTTRTVGPGDPEALLEAAFQAIGSNLRGGDPRLRGIIGRSLRSGAGPQAALQDVQLAQQILGIGQNNSALDQITEKFSDLIATAKRLRLPLEKINEAFRDALTSLETQLVNRLQSIKQQANQALGLNVLLPFQQQLQTGQLSGLSAQDRLAASRQRLDELSQAARQGDLSAIREFPQVAQQTLGLGREVFASGPRFQQLFTSVNRTLNEIISQQEALQQGFGQGLDLSIRETSQDQIKVLREEFAATRESLEEVREELARRSA